MSKKSWRHGSPLSKLECISLLKAAEKMGLKGLIIQFAFLTGQSMADIRQMRWDDIDWTNNTWCIFKGDFEVMIPLSPQAMDVLKRVWPRRQHQDCVFPKVNPDRLKRGLIKEAGVQSEINEPGLRWYFIFTDMRTTVGYGLERGGYELELIDWLLDHKHPNIAQGMPIPDEDIYLERKRAALDGWDECVEDLMAKRGPLRTLKRLKRAIGRSVQRRKARGTSAPIER